MEKRTKIPSYPNINKIMEFIHLLTISMRQPCTWHSSSLIHQCKRNLKNKLFEFAKEIYFYDVDSSHNLCHLWIYFVCVIQLTMNDEKRKKRWKYWLNQERKRFCSFRRLGKFNKMNRLWVNIERIIIEAELMAERCNVDAHFLLLSALGFQSNTECGTRNCKNGKKLKFLMKLWSNICCFRIW